MISVKINNLTYFLHITYIDGSMTNSSDKRVIVLIDNQEKVHKDAL